MHISIAAECLLKLLPLHSFVFTHVTAQELLNEFSWYFSFWRGLYKYLQLHLLGNILQGSVIAEAVSCRPRSVEAQVQSQAIPFGIFGRRSGTGTGIFPSALVLYHQYYSTSAPYSFISHQHCIMLTTDTVSKEHNSNVIQLLIFNIFCLNRRVKCL
jgi:hypothetical protein